MRLPRDLTGRDLSKLLHQHFGYQVVRQPGSHLRLTTSVGGEHRVTIPTGGPLRVGTLAAILNDVAVHHGITRAELEIRMFGERGALTTDEVRSSNNRWRRVLGVPVVLAQ